MIKVTSTGPYGGYIDKDLKKYIKSAVKYFAQELGIDKLPLSIEVRVHNKSVLAKDTEGLTEKRNDSSFRVSICLYSNWVSVLAHEMVHVKQFARNEIDQSLTRWKSKKCNSDIDYWEQPWEKEARKLQIKMMRKYDLKFQLGE